MSKQAAPTRESFNLQVSMKTLCARVDSVLDREAKTVKEILDALERRSIVETLSPGTTERHTRLWRQQRPKPLVEHTCITTVPTVGKLGNKHGNLAVSCSVHGRWL